MSTKIEMYNAVEGIGTDTSIEFSIASSNAAGTGSQRSNANDPTQAAAAPRTIHKAKGSSSHPPLSRRATFASPLGSRVAVTTPTRSASASLAEEPVLLRPSRFSSSSDASALFIQAVTNLDTSRQSLLGGPQQQHDFDSDEERSDKAGSGHPRMCLPSYRAAGFNEEGEIEGKAGRASAASHAVSSSRSSIIFQNESDAAVAAPASAAPPQPPPSPPTYVVSPKNPTSVKPAVAPSKAMTSPAAGQASSTPSPSPPPPPGIGRIINRAEVAGVRQPPAIPPMSAVSLPSAHTGVSTITASTQGRAGSSPSPRDDVMSAPARLAPAFPNSEGFPSTTMDQERLPRADGGDVQRHLRTPSLPLSASPLMSHVASHPALHRAASYTHAVPRSLARSESPQYRPLVTFTNAQSEEDPVYCTVSEMTNAASMRGGTYSILPSGFIAPGACGSVAGAVPSARRLSAVPSVAAAVRHVQSFDLSLDESNALLTVNTPRDVPMNKKSSPVEESGKTKVLASPSLPAASVVLSHSPSPQNLHQIMPLPTFTHAFREQRASGVQITTRKSSAAACYSATAAGTASTRTNENSTAAPPPPGTHTSPNSASNRRSGRWAYNGTPAKSAEGSVCHAASSGPSPQEDAREAESAPPPHRRNSVSAVFRALGRGSLLCRPKSCSTVSKSGTGGNEEGSRASLSSRQCTSNSGTTNASRISSRLKRSAQKAVLSCWRSDSVPAQQRRPAKRRVDAATEMKVAVDTTVSAAAAMSSVDLQAPLDSPARGSGSSATPAPTTAMPAQLHAVHLTPAGETQSSVDESIHFQIDAEDTKATLMSHEGQRGRTHPAANAPDPTLHLEPALILSRLAESVGDDEGREGDATPKRERYSPTGKKRRRRRHHHRSQSTSSEARGACSSADASSTASSAAAASRELHRQKDMERRRRHRRERRERRRTEAGQQQRADAEGGGDDLHAQSRTSSHNRSTKSRVKRRTCRSRHAKMISAEEKESSMLVRRPPRHWQRRWPSCEGQGQPDAVEAHREVSCDGAARDAHNRKGRAGASVDARREQELAPAAALVACRRALLVGSRVHSTVNHFRAARHARNVHRRRLWHQQYDAYMDRKRKLQELLTERRLRSQEAAIAAAVATAASRSASRARAAHDDHNAAVRGKPSVASSQALKSDRSVSISPPACPSDAAVQRLDSYEAALTNDIVALDEVIEKMRRRQLWMATSPTAAAAARTAGICSSQKPKSLLRQPASTQSITEVEDTETESKRPTAGTRSNVNRRLSAGGREHTAPPPRPATGPCAPSCGAAAGPRACRTHTLTAGPLSASSFTISAKANRQRCPSGGAAESQDRSATWGVEVMRGGSSPAPRKPLESRLTSVPPGPSHLPDATPYTQPSPGPETQRAAEQQTVTPSDVARSVCTHTTTAELQRRYESLLDEVIKQAEGEGAPSEQEQPCRPYYRASSSVSASLSDGGHHCKLNRKDENSGLPVSPSSVGASQRSFRGIHSRAPALSASGDVEKAVTRWCAEALRAEYYEVPRSARPSLSPCHTASGLPQQPHRLATANSSHRRGADKAADAALEDLERIYVQSLHPSCSVCRPQRFEEYVALGLLSMLHDSGQDTADRRDVEAPRANQRNGGTAPMPSTPPSSTLLLQRRVREELYAPPKRSQRDRAGATHARQPSATPQDTRKAQTATVAVTADIGAASSSKSVPPSFYSAPPAAVEALWRVPQPTPRPFTPSLSLILESLRVRVAKVERRARRVLADEEEAAVQALRRHYIIETVVVLRALRAAEEAEEEKRRKRQQERFARSPHILSIPEHHADDEHHTHEPVTPSVGPASLLAKTFTAGCPYKNHASPQSLGLWEVPGGSPDDAEQSSSTSNVEDGHHDCRHAAAAANEGDASSTESKDLHSSSHACSGGDTAPLPPYVKRLDEGGQHARLPSVESDGHPVAVCHPLQHGLGLLRSVSASPFTDLSRTPLSFTRNEVDLAVVSGNNSANDSRGRDPAIVVAPPNSPKGMLPVMPVLRESSDEEEDRGGAVEDVCSHRRSGGAAAEPVSNSSAYSVPSHGEAAHAAVSQSSSLDFVAEEVVTALVLELHGEGDSHASSALRPTTERTLPPRAAEGTAAEQPAEDGDDAPSQGPAATREGRSATPVGAKLMGYKEDEKAEPIPPSSSSFAIDAATQDSANATADAEAVVVDQRRSSSSSASTATSTSCTPVDAAPRRDVCEAALAESNSTRPLSIDCGDHLIHSSSSPSADSREDASDASHCEEARNAAGHTPACVSNADATSADGGDKGEDVAPSLPAASSSSSLWSTDDGGQQQLLQQRVPEEVPSSRGVPVLDHPETMEEDTEGEANSRNNDIDDKENGQEEEDYAIHMGAAEAQEGVATILRQDLEAVSSDVAVEAAEIPPSEDENSERATSAVTLTGDAEQQQQQQVNGEGEVDDGTTTPAAALRQPERRQPQRSPHRRVHFSLPLESTDKYGAPGEDDNGGGEGGAKGSGLACRNGGEGDGGEGSAAHQLREVSEPNSVDAATPETSARHVPVSNTSEFEAEDEEEDSVSEKSAIDLLEKLNGLDALLLQMLPTYFTTGTDSDGLPGAVMRRGRDVYTPKRVSPHGAVKGASCTPSPSASALMTGGSPVSEPVTATAVFDEKEIVGASAGSGPVAAASSLDPSALDSAAALQSDAAPPIYAHAYLPDSAPSPSPSMSPPCARTHLAPPQLPAESLASQLRRKYHLQSPPPSFRHASWNISSTPTIATAAAATVPGPSATPSSYLLNRSSRVVPTLPSALSAYTSGVVPSSAMDASIKRREKVRPMKKKSGVMEESVALKAAAEGQRAQPTQQHPPSAELPSGNANATTMVALATDKNTLESLSSAQANEFLQSRSVDMTGSAPIMAAPVATPRLPSSFSSSFAITATVSPAFTPVTEGRMGEVAQNAIEGTPLATPTRASHWF
ncbi:hypothetical protein ABL78_2861 [Leptomonas seymouri]|uniref:Uncharacterized protein n=1 Tax=Leptomonas seymouri TaxID=5684 RepID=A0A0N1PCZ3_LEPSE|nr:hypothetical protein ABL78_2861 [Leptomonas seymouri]|eukprot:KPI88035.1 hypothetical protein ABL78_2861 [Leptomonas seymouri]